MKINISLLAALAATAMQLDPTVVLAIPILITASPNAPIPVDDPSGIVSAIDLSSSLLVGDVTVTLDITGGYDGDFYAYLRHTDSGGNVGFSVLLNRIASGTGSSPAYGMKVTFDATAPSTIDSASSGPGQPLAGTYQPDGSLGAFNGLGAGGQWQLFIGDESMPDQGILTSWTLDLSAHGPATSVPDNGPTLVMLIAGCCLLFGAAARKLPGTRNDGIQPS
jgi:subtilisin-like proprotein convertase family protein